MSKGSIYSSTRKKLRALPASATKEGRVLSADKTLILKFVKLERALRADDFDLILNAAAMVEAHLARINKRHLTSDLYQYIWTHAGGSSTNSDTIDGRSVITVEYRKVMSKDAALTHQWAIRMYDVRNKHNARVVYANHHDYL